MENGHVTETTEKSRLAEVDPAKNAVCSLDSLTTILCEAHKRLTAEMETTPCNQTRAAQYAVKTALEVLDARNKNRVAAAKG